jgi:Uma2 family endonuclease
MEARILDLPPDPERDPEAFYHAHEEVNVPVTGAHDETGDYMRDALSVHLPHRWVGEDRCCYWIEGNNQVFLGPDIFVAERPRPHVQPSSFRLWEHGPLLFVAEIASRSSFRKDVGPKLERYAEGLQPDEYLYYDADHADLRLHRRTDLGYVRLSPDSQGRLWSEAVEASFAIEDGVLRVFDAEGNRLPSHLEEAALRLEAEETARAERQRTEAERQRAEAERQRAEAALVEVAALRAELTRLRGSG